MMWIRRILKKTAPGSAEITDSSHVMPVAVVHSRCHLSVVVNIVMLLMLAATCGG